ncbi:MAG: radical SAM protein [bacterium]|nr:radical SAM protein [bacterium]
MLKQKIDQRILLINPPEIIGNGLNSPPLALLYLAGTLKKHHIKVKIVDGLLCGWKGIKQEIKKNRPTVVGTTSLTVSRLKSYKVLKLAKEINPTITTILGGVHATLLHSQIIDNYPFIDIVVRGEGERTLLQIVQGIALENIAGITYRKNNQTIINRPQKYFENLDEIPFPAWDLIDLTKYPALPVFVTSYNGIDTKKVPLIQVIFSRGCPGRCNFCSTWTIWRGWRGRSGQNMADEIEILYTKHKMRHFIFADDCMTVNKKETINFCNEIIRRKLKIAFSVQTRTDQITLEILKKLKQAGCYGISYGIESGSEKILQLMDKNNSLKKNETAILLSKKAGLLVNAEMITGAFGETISTLNQTIRFLRKTEPDFVITLGGLWVLPETKIYHHLKKLGEINDDYWLKNNKPMVYLGHFTDRQIRYFKLNVERRQLIDPHKQPWNSFSFLTFYYADKLARSNFNLINLLRKFYAPINQFAQKIIN